MHDRDPPLDRTAAQHQHGGGIMRPRTLHGYPSHGPAAESCHGDIRFVVGKQESKGGHLRGGPCTF